MKRFAIAVLIGWAFGALLTGLLRAADDAGHDPELIIPGPRSGTVDCWW